MVSPSSQPLGRLHGWRIRRPCASLCPPWICSIIRVTWETPHGFTGSGLAHDGFSTTAAPGQPSLANPARHLAEGAAVLPTLARAACSPARRRSVGLARQHPGRLEHGRSIGPADPWPERFAPFVLHGPPGRASAGTAVARRSPRMFGPRGSSCTRSSSAIALSGEITSCGIASVARQAG